MKNVIIIGSGFSSLASACYMAKAGFEVTVLEKNDQIGGRASMLEMQGFKFDMGPSWYWMPDIFERFFADFGKKVSDYYQLEKLSPGYRVYFGENDFIDISDKPEEIIQTFEEIEKGSGEHLRKFMKDSKKNYEIAMQDAREKAESMAKASGRKLGKVLSVSDGGTSTNYPMYLKADSGMGGGAATEPGRSTVYKTINVVFELK